MSSFSFEDIRQARSAAAVKTLRNDVKEVVSRLHKLDGLVEQFHNLKLTGQQR